MLAHGRWPVGRDGKSKDEKPEMNEHEKSDYPIVPAKPPNKGTGEGGHGRRRRRREGGGPKGIRARATRPGRRAG